MQSCTLSVYRSTQLYLCFGLVHSVHQSSTIYRSIGPVYSIGLSVYQSSPLYWSFCPSVQSTLSVYRSIGPVHGLPVNWSSHSRLQELLVLHDVGLLLHELAAAGARLHALVFCPVLSSPVQSGPFLTYSLTPSHTVRGQHTPAVW